MVCETQKTRTPHNDVGKKRVDGVRGCKVSVLLFNEEPEVLPKKLKAKLQRLTRRIRQAY